MDKVIEQTEQESFTLARWIAEPGSAPWLWVSHNPHEQFKTMQEAQKVAEAEKIIPGFFVVQISRYQKITRCGEANG